MESNQDRLEIFANHPTERHHIDCGGCDLVVIDRDGVFCAPKRRLAECDGCGRLFFKSRVFDSMKRENPPSALHYISCVKHAAASLPRYDNSNKKQNVQTASVTPRPADRDLG